MATLTDQDVTKIAHLARLEISAAEIPQHAENLSKILAFVEQINSVNTDNITPLAHSLAGSQRLRADEITQINQRELMQSVAPQAEAGLYLVPKVIEACELEEQ